MKTNKFDYEHKQYLNMFETIDQSFYKKYIDFIQKYLKHKNKKFLEVGCGNGNALIPIKDKGFKNIYGCELSKLFASACKKRGLENISTYDGKILPYKDNTFDLVASFGVLEHVSDPKSFLKQNIKKTKKNGYIIVTCPNFLSVFFKLEHPRTDTLQKRLKNIPRIIKKLFSNKVEFEHIEPIIRPNFQADDDMITISNSIDIERFFRQNNCKVVYSNGFMANDSFIHKILGSIFIFKYLLPSCFVVAQKQ